MKVEFTHQFILFVLILSFGINKSNAQSEILDNSLKEENLISKNSIYGNIGSVVTAVSLGGYYERILVQNGSNRNYSTFARVGYGVIGSGNGGTSYLLAQYGWLTGAKKNHLEIGAGLMYLSSGTVAPSGTLGWRVQVPGPSFVFRMGIGVPDLVYLGIGFSF